MKVLAVFDEQTTLVSEGVLFVTVSKFCKHNHQGLEWFEFKDAPSAIQTVTDVIEKQDEDKVRIYVQRGDDHVADGVCTVGQLEEFFGGLEGIAVATQQRLKTPQV